MDLLRLLVRLLSLFGLLLRIEETAEVSSRGVLGTSNLLLDILVQADDVTEAGGIGRRGFLLLVNSLLVNLLLLLLGSSLERSRDRGSRID